MKIAKRPHEHSRNCYRWVSKSVLLILSVLSCKISIYVTAPKWWQKPTMTRSLRPCCSLTKVVIRLLPIRGYRILYSGSSASRIILTYVFVSKSRRATHSDGWIGKEIEPLLLGFRELLISSCRANTSDGSAMGLNRHYQMPASEWFGQLRYITFAENYFPC